MEEEIIQKTNEEEQKPKETNDNKINEPPNNNQILEEKNANESNPSTLAKSPEDLIANKEDRDKDKDKDQVQEVFLNLPRVVIVDQPKENIQNTTNKKTENEDLNLKICYSLPNKEKILNSQENDNDILDSKIDDISKNLKSKIDDNEQTNSPIVQHSLSPSAQTNIQLIINENYYDTFEANVNINTNNNQVNPEVIKRQEHKEYMKKLKEALITSQKELIDIHNDKIQKLVKRNKEINTDDFFKKKRNYLIMTEGGKPIYSRYGDEVQNNGIFATLSAMITKFTVFIDETENLNLISNDKMDIVFLKKGQLIFIVLSKKHPDNISFLYSQLNYLYLQVMSILSNHFYYKLEDSPLECLATLNGTDALFENMIKLTSNSIISVLDSYPVLPFNNHERINKICHDNMGDALICIILTPYEIVGISHVESIPIKSSDIILIQNLIFSSPSLRKDESWVPLCLPGISPDGYLQLYCHFHESNIGVCLLTESVDPTYFMKFTGQYENIISDLESEDLFDEIIYAEMKLINYEKKEKNKNKNLDEDEELKIKIRAIEYMSEEQINDELNEKISYLRKPPSTNNRWNIFDIVPVNILNMKNNNTNNNNSQNFPLSKANSFAGNNVNNNNNESNVGANNSIISNTKDENFGIVLKDVFYGICKNKKMNQFFVINFNNNFFNSTKQEKFIYNEYYNLYEKYAELDVEEDSKNDFFYFYKGERYYNVIYQSGYLLLIASFNFFSNIEDIGNRAKNIIKHIRDNENYYFLLFK